MFMLLCCAVLCYGVVSGCVRCVALCLVVLCCLLLCCYVYLCCVVCDRV